MAKSKRSAQSASEASVREWPSPVCEQPECALRRIQFNRTRIAELLVKAVTRDDGAKPVPEQERILPRKVCFDCALRVVRGQRPFMTVDEKSSIIEKLESDRNGGFVLIEGEIDGDVVLDDALDKDLDDDGGVN